MIKLDIVSRRVDLLHLLLEGFELQQVWRAKLHTVEFLLMGLNNIGGALVVGSWYIVDGSWGLISTTCESSFVGPLFRT